MVDESDLATLLFDLNDPTGVNNANYGGLQTATREFLLRAPGRKVNQFMYPDQPGGTTTWWNDQLIQTTFKLAIEGSANTASYDNLRLGIGRVQQLLSRSGVLLLQETGSSNVRYIRYEPCENLPALLQADPADPFRALTSFIYGDGIPIELWRQPYLYGPQILSSTNVLDNGSLLRDINLDGRPNVWAWGNAASITAEAIVDEAYAFNIAANLTRNLQQQTAAASAANGQTWTLSFWCRLKPGGAAGAIQVAPVLDFMDNTSTVLTTSAANLVTPTSAWQRVSVTFTASNANTDHMRANLRAVSGAGATDLEWKQAQLEQAPAASLYVDGTSTFANDPSVDTGRALPIFIQGDAPTQVVPVLTADTGAKMTLAYLAKCNYGGGITGGQNLADWLNSTHYAECNASGNGWTVAGSGGTLGTDTTSVADANASGGNAAKCTFVSASVYHSKRVTISRTTLLDSLRGYFDVYLRAKADNAGIFKVKLHWGAGALAPAPNSELVTEVTHDLVTNGTPVTFDYVDLYLGRVFIPEKPVTLAQARFEIWARRASGTGNMWFDTLSFVPVDPVRPQNSKIRIPGRSKEFHKGSDLAAAAAQVGGAVGDPAWTPATVNGDSVRLTQNNQAVGIQPNSGQGSTKDWPVGRHIIVYHVFASQALTNCQFDIVDITDSSYAAVGTPRVPSGHQIFTLFFDSVAGKLYQARASMRFGAPPAGGYLDVKRIWHYFVPYMQQNEQLRSDPTRYAIEKLDANGNIQTSASGQGPVPIEMEPGLNVLWGAFGDAPIQYYNEEDSVLGRKPTLNYSYWPAYWG